jgi:hypothetical protein
MRGSSLSTRSLIVAIAVLACGDPSEPSGSLSIEIVDGDGQQAVTMNGAQTFTGTGYLADTLRVRVVNSAGNPVEGVTVIWAADAGGLEPNVSTTDASGIAAARWSWFSTVTGWAPVGTHRATAGVPDVGTVNFTGQARAGVVLHELSISPDTVDVSTGAAQSTIAVRVTDDRPGFGMSYVLAFFFSPAGSGSMITTLAPVSGSPMDGVWEGTITVPQDADAGSWELFQLTLGWGCGGANRIVMPGVKLEQLDLPSQFYVLGTDATGQRAGHSLLPDVSDLHSTRAVSAQCSL